MSASLRLAEHLISLPSVTPDDAGCIDLIAERLEGLNYTHNGKGFYGYSENLDPHPNIARWIEYKVAEEVRA